MGSPAGFVESWDLQMEATGVGVNALIQSDYGDEAASHLEALVQVGDRAIFIWRDPTSNDGWRSPGAICDDVRVPPAIVQGDYVDGADHHNFEALIVRGDGELQHWWRDNTRADIPWTQSGTITTGANGVPSLTVSDYRETITETTTSKRWVTYDHPNIPKGSAAKAGRWVEETRTETRESEYRNFEALVPTASGLWHFTRRNGQPTTWEKRHQLSQDPHAVGSIIQSDYRSLGDHGNFEALVFEPDVEGRPWGTLTHFWFDGIGWNRGVRLDVRALGPASLIQSDYEHGANHHNLEALIEELEDATDRPVLRLWFRDNHDDDHDVGDWRPAGAALPLATDATGRGVCLLQGSLGASSDHGNFEALAVSDPTSIEHFWRDQTNGAWRSGGAVYPTGW